VNPGILTSGYAPPPMPSGLLGSPRAVPMIDPYGYDADATRYIEAVERADGQRLELAVQLAINAFVVGCKSDGIWPAIRTSCILMGARTLAGCLTPLAGQAPTNFNFVSADYNRKNGLKGGGFGSGKYLTQPIPAGSYQNDHSFSVFVSAKSGAGNNWGCSNNNNFFGYFGGETTAVQFRSASSLQLSHGTIKTVGLIGASRSVAGEYVCRNAGINVTQTQASGGGANTPLFVFAGAGGNNIVADTQAFYHFGASLNLALLEARVSALRAAIGAAIP
jgi:hypothetical protein